MKEGKSHTPPHDARENSCVFFYLTENHMEVEFGPCTQQTSCHTDCRGAFLSIALPFSLKQIANIKV